ncbi:MAG TPA: protein-disulfide reductase DsbD domain-containing protein, partial [Pelobium sp.]|nr:protein-disulfide reductase DsbD domain-containing protein [Pelobium sp.]
MKKIIAISALLLLSICVFAQILKPVTWSYSAETISEREANLLITAKMDAGWHVYSQFIEEGGPIPTSFTFSKSADYELVGKPTETPKAVSAYDNNFAMQIAWHEKLVVFKQKIKLKKPEVTVKGSLEFMVCNDKQCLPPEEIEFAIKVTGGKPSAAQNPAQATVSPTGVADTSSKRDSAVSDSSISVNASPSTPVDSSKTVLNNIDDQTNQRSLWAIFIAGFIGGILALLMPCIFPMLPLTVSFFTKKASSRAVAVRKASLYGFFIIVIYVLLGMGITLIFGSDALNSMASNGFLNFLFFVMLVIFAISFFGAFEINLPSSWTNKIDEKSDNKGVVGVFFMA